MARPKNIVASVEVPVEEMGHGKKFESLRRRLGVAAGGEKLGCSLYELPPGKAAFPFHAHLANEEAVYVLQGEGVLRLGEAEHPIGAGDYIMLRAGGEPHRLNGQPTAFRYYWPDPAALTVSISAYDA